MNGGAFRAFVGLLEVYGIVLIYIFISPRGSKKQ